MFLNLVNAFKVFLINLAILYLVGYKKEEILINGDALNWRLV
jgi:hypothetical protein